jgi:hypothetical protein
MGPGLGGDVVTAGWIAGQAFVHGAGGSLDPGSVSVELKKSGFPRKLDLGYEVMRPQTIDHD